MAIIKRQKTILIAPLDWGLGHATRCVPIIKLLIDQNYAVIVACTPNQAPIFSRFKQEIEVLSLFSYNIKYSKKKWWLPFSLLLQIPKIGKAIQKENKWLQQTIKEKNIDIVISDNRYGLHSKQISTVFITHQLTIKTPFKWAEALIQKIIYKYINKFSQVWVPDVKGENALAGELSNPQNLPKIPVHYIGHLNRFFGENEEMEDEIELPTKIDVLILLSGPEPQRSILEEIIIKQIPNLAHLQFVLLRGLPNNKETEFNIPLNTIAFHHLTQKKIKELITKANFIIARSGYTTVMEVLSMQKKCIFIPTPGQTEQEYLAKYLAQKQFCIFNKQADFNLKNNLLKANDFNFKITQTLNSKSEIIIAFKKL